MEERIIKRTTKVKEDERLFELYKACLTGWHANIGGNKATGNQLAEYALEDAKAALEVWNERS